LLETTDHGRVKTGNDYEIAGAIAEDLDYFPLALEQTRAYIVTHELSFELYRKNWQANHIAVMGWFNKNQMQYPSSVAVALQSSFNQLSEAATILLTGWHGWPRILYPKLYWKWN
jgi:hypothetical protein